MFWAVDLQVPTAKGSLDEGAMVRSVRILGVLHRPEVPAGDTHQAGGDLLGLLKLQNGVKQVDVEFFLGGRTEGFKDGVECMGPLDEAMGDERPGRLKGHQHVS